MLRDKHVPYSVLEWLLRKCRGIGIHTNAIVCSVMLNIACVDAERRALSPAGGALHIHSTSLASAEWLVKNATYRPHCYICRTWDNSVRFVFSQRRPYPRWDCLFWQLVSTLRAKASDLNSFDERYRPSVRPPNPSFLDGRSALNFDRFQA